MQLDSVDQLLCDCLGRLPDEELASLLTTISSPDWGNFLHRSSIHGVSPLVYKRLKDPTLSSNIPAHILEDLNKKYLHTAYKNTLILHNLGKVLQAFNDANIQVIPLKGIQLAENIYQNIALRTMGDVDLLVHKSDLDQVQRKLTELGYASRPFWLDAENDLSHALPPYSKHNSAELDIHWSFENPDSPFKVDDEGLWQRAIPIQIAEVDVHTLSPEDFLLHLCMHVSYHHRFESGLRSLCDISATLGCFDHRLDWPILLTRAKDWGVERCVFLSLHLAQLLIGAKLPSGLLDQLSPKDYGPRMETWAIELVFPNLSQEQNVSINIAKTWNQHGILAKAAMFLSFVFPSRSIMSTRYPVAPNSIKVYLYYPRRWFDLLSRHGRSLWNLIIGNKSARLTNQREMQGWELAEWLSKPGQ